MKELDGATVADRLVRVCLTLVDEDPAQLDVEALLMTCREVRGADSTLDDHRRAVAYLRRVIDLYEAAGDRCSSFHNDLPVVSAGLVLLTEAGQQAGSARTDVLARFIGDNFEQFCNDPALKAWDAAWTAASEVA